MDRAVIVAFGSNLPGESDSPRALLEAAVTSMGDAGLAVTHVSRWWRSAAWPDPADPPYVNGVVLIETNLGPAQVLARLHDIERAFGRDRAARNAPRTLDLDLIAHGRVVGDAPTIPHPRAHERRFVMGPLAEIAPDWVHPALGQSAAMLARGAGVGADAAPLQD